MRKGALSYHGGVHGHRNLYETERSAIARYRNFNAPKICKITAPTSNLFSLSLMQSVEIAYFLPDQTDQHHSSVFAFGCVFLPALRLFFTSCSILSRLDLCLSLFSALEESMFHFSDPNSPSSRPQLFLRAQEKVFIPFKFQCLQEPTQQVRKPTINKKIKIKKKISGLSDGFFEKEEEIQN